MAYELKWGEEPEGYNTDGDGGVGIATVANAIQCWSLFQGCDTSVADAAKAFNIAPERVVEAVQFNSWMFLAGPADDYEKLMIEHDGE